MYGDRLFNIGSDNTALFSYSILKNFAKKVYMYELDYRGEFSELDKYAGVGLVPADFGKSCKHFTINSLK